MTSNPYELAVELARTGLASAAPSLTSAPLAAEVWREVVRIVRTERVEGFLARAIGEGRLPAEAWQADEAEERHVAAAAMNLRLERFLLDAHGALVTAGIQPLVLKGPAVAHLDYPDPALRSFTDVDLLVRSEDVDGAVRLFQDAGLTRRFPEPRPGFDRRFAKSVTMLAADGTELDLHRTLALGRFGLSVALEDLWEAPAEVLLGGERVPALAGNHRFLHACYHAALGGARPRLTALRDVVEIARQQEVDPTEVRQIARAWDAEPVLARAVLLVDGMLGADVLGLAAWARERRIRTSERRALRAYVDRPTYAAKSWRAIGAVPRGRERAAFVLALVWPRRSYVTGRHHGRLARWWRAMRGALARRRGC